MEPATSAPAPVMDRMAVCKRIPLCISAPWGGVEPLKQAADGCPIVARRSLQEPPPFRAGEFQALGLEASGGVVRVEPVDYNTLEEIKIFGEALGRIVGSEG